jgi:hypothetical protein
MRSPWFLAAVLVALFAAGWAFYTLSGEPEGGAGKPGAASKPSPRREAPASARTRARRGSDPRSESTREATAATAVDSPASPTSGEEEPAIEAPGEGTPEGGPAPRVKPAVDLPQARADFQAVLDELDAHAAAEHHLDNPEWVEIYKRGNDALLPLQQHLQWDVPEEAEELRAAQTKLREKLHAVAPRPVDPRP